MGTLQLNCLIEGSIVFVVTVERDCVISDLKEKIHGKRALGILKDVDPHTLELWKVNIDLEARDERYLNLLKIETLLKVKKLKKLTSWKSVEGYCSDGLSNTYLHIIVVIPASSHY